MSYDTTGGAGPRSPNKGRRAGDPFKLGVARGSSINESDLIQVTKALL